MNNPNLEGESLAAEGRRRLKIDVPVYRIENFGGYVRFYLYGGLVVDYPTNSLPEHSLDPSAALTAVPGKKKRPKKPKPKKEA